MAFSRRKRSSFTSTLRGQSCVQSEVSPGINCISLDMCTQQLTVTFEADRVGNPRNDRPQLRSHHRPPDTARLMRPAVVQSALKPHAGGVPSDRDEYSLRNHLQGPTLRPESTLSSHLWGLYVARLSKRLSTRIFDVNHSSSSCVLGPPCFQVQPRVGIVCRTASATTHH